VKLRPLGSLVAFVAGLVALAVFRFGRGYPWMLAAIVAVAIGVLIAGAFLTYERLAPLWRDDPGPPEDS